MCQALPSEAGTEKHGRCWAMLKFTLGSQCQIKQHVNKHTAYNHNNKLCTLLSNLAPSAWWANAVCKLYTQQWVISRICGPLNPTTLSNGGIFWTLSVKSERSANEMGIFYIVPVNILNKPTRWELNDFISSYFTKNRVGGWKNTPLLLEVERVNGCFLTCRLQEVWRVEVLCRHRRFAVTPLVHT